MWRCSKDTSATVLVVATITDRQVEFKEKIMEIEIQMLLGGAS